MPLQSPLFRGDRALEAAAVSDTAHITPGARGEHVRKIQLALIQLDGASIVADGIYGPATAAAVLAYKRKRNIINPAYQAAPDNIVGKMTMNFLDQEMQNAPFPVDDDSAEVGAAILATLLKMDTALGQASLSISGRLRAHLELLRAEAALATKGNLNFDGQIRFEYERRTPHLAEIGFAPKPFVFAAVPVVVAGGAITALEIAIAALAIILILCIVSKDFRDLVSRMVEEAIEAASDTIIDVITEVAVVDRMVDRCKETNPNPSSKCADRQDEYKQRKSELVSARSEASKALSDALARLGKVPAGEMKFLLNRLEIALRKLEQALRALKEAANSLFDDCGCLFPKV
jgi:hypothetical protein